MTGTYKWYGGVTIGTVAYGIPFNAAQVLKIDAETDAVTLIGEVGTGTRNCYIKNVVLFEENSILPLPGRLEASGVESVWGEVSQESPKNR